MNTKEIFLVKYCDIHIIPSAKVNKNSTYNLMAFNDLRKAKEFANTKLDTLIDPLLEADFRILLSTGEMNGVEDIVWIRRVKVIRDTDDDFNKYQTRLFEFSIESIKLV